MAARNQVQSSSAIKWTKLKHADAVRSNSVKRKQSKLQLALVAAVTSICPETFWPRVKVGGTSINLEKISKDPPTHSQVSQNSRTLPFGRQLSPCCKWTSSGGDYEPPPFTGSGAQYEHMVCQNSYWSKFVRFTIEMHWTPSPDFRQRCLSDGQCKLEAIHRRICMCVEQLGTERGWWAVVTYTKKRQRQHASTLSTWFHLIPCSHHVGFQWEMFPNDSCLTDTSSFHRNMIWSSNKMRNDTQSRRYNQLKFPRYPTVYSSFWQNKNCSYIYISNLTSTYRLRKGHAPSFHQKDWKSGCIPKAVSHQIRCGLGVSVCKSKLEGHLISWSTSVKYQPNGGKSQWSSTSIRVTAIPYFGCALRQPRLPNPSRETNSANELGPPPYTIF